MKRFDIVTALLTLAGKLHARRLARAIAKERALQSAIQATTKAYQVAVLDRQNVQLAELKVPR